jgi:hypothetical protein
VVDPPEPLSGPIGGRLFSPVRRFLSAHPVVFLLILAPEVEYLTGSTQASWLVNQPILFFLFLAQNLASYGAAVLLIREARIRWGLGWAGVLFLGAGYGIINEGLGVSTLFRTQASGLAGAGTYWHVLGVNWLNVASLIVIVHPLFSVSIPILFLDLALPMTRGRALLDSREIAIAFYALCVDAFVTCFFVYRVTGFLAGPALWGACLGSIAFLAVAAWALPRDLFRPATQISRAGAFPFAALGLAFVWILGLGQAVLVHIRVWPPLIVVYLLGVAAAALTYVLRNIGRNYSLQVVALAGGLVISLIPMGFFGQLTTGPGIIPVVFIDAMTVAFVLYLSRRYAPATQLELRRGGELSSHPVDHPRGAS